MHCIAKGETPSLLVSPRARRPRYLVGTAMNKMAMRAKQSVRYQLRVRFSWKNVVETMHVKRMEAEQDRAKSREAGRWRTAFCNVNCRMVPNASMKLPIQPFVLKCHVLRTMTSDVQKMKIAA